MNIDHMEFEWIPIGGSQIMGSQMMQISRKWKEENGVALSVQE
jgi:hypothetical protein